MFSRLKAMIRHSIRAVREEVMWSISNLFVFTNVKGIGEYLSDIGFWEGVIDLAVQDSKNVRKWAMVSVMNAIQFKDFEFADTILQVIPETDLI